MFPTIEEWKAYLAAIEEENGKRELHNKDIHRRTDEKLKPRERRFLWFKWQEHPHPIQYQAAYSFERVFSKKYVEPTLEGYLTWKIEGKL